MPLVSDFVHAVRALRKTPGSSLLALVMLAVGIAATSAIFSVVYTVLLRPLPFAEPERVVQIWESRLDRGWRQASFTEANFWDIREQNRSFEEVGAYHWDDANMTGSGDPEHLSVGLVSAGFFSALGVHPVLGRSVLPGEDQPGHDNNVLLISNRFWRKRFASDRNLLSRTLQLDNKPYVVIGVLPPGEPWLNAADVFIPLVHGAKPNRDSFEYQVVGRLKQGITLAAARTDLERICKGLAAQYSSDAGMGVTLAPASDWIASAWLRRALWILMGAVGFLLLIACINLANLLLVRATGRGREIAIRFALGASRGRIARLVLAESLTLGLAGSVLGLALAAAMVRMFKASNIAGVPRVEEVSMNVWVLGFTLVVALGTGILSGTFPAVHIPYSNLIGALREGERGQAGSRTQRRLRAALIGGEIALSVALLVGAGLLIRSFIRVVEAERGFSSDRRIVLAVSIPGSFKKDRYFAVIDQMIARLASAPQVSAAAAVNVRPIVGGDPGMGYAAVEKIPAKGEAVPWASWRFIAGDYFRTMGIPLLRGRSFADGEAIGKPWRVVISQSVAGALWPHQDPIGRSMVLWQGQGGNPAEVIGVVGNMRERGLDADPTPIVYMPYRGAMWSPVQFIVHTTGKPEEIVPVFRSLLKQVDATLPVSDVATLDEVIGDSLGTRRFNTYLLGVFAGIALLLAMAGVYGVLAYTVARRTAEIGIRMALGASHLDILRLTIGQGMKPIAVGIAAGLAGALVMSRLLTSLLLGVRPADPITYAGVTILVGATALLSCYIPARRALRILPMNALRQE